jgi:hypothetical protein
MVNKTERLFSFNAKPTSLTVKKLRQVETRPAFRQLGWALNDVLDVTYSLQGVLQRFEEQTFNSVRFRVSLVSGEPPGPGQLLRVNPNQKRIDLYLDGGPDKVRDRATMGVALALASVAPRIKCEDNGLPAFELRYPVRPNSFNAAAIHIADYYAGERFGDFLTADFPVLLARTMRTYCSEAALYSVARTLCSQPDQFGRLLMANSRDFLGRIRAGMACPVINADEYRFENIFETVAGLALFAVALRGQGMLNESFDCLSELFGPLGKQLRYAEFLLIQPRDYEQYQRFPFRFHSQINQYGMAGLNMIFNAILAALEPSYKEALLIPRFGPGFTGRVEGGSITVRRRN